MGAHGTFVLEYHYEGKKHFYTPDVLVAWGSDRHVVEVKEDADADLPENRARPLHPAITGTTSRPTSTWPLMARCRQAGPGDVSKWMATVLLLTRRGHSRNASKLSYALDLAAESQFP